MSTVSEDILPQSHENDRNILERRLDSLAWLLEGTSMCAAVAIIDGKLYISANDFFDGTIGNQHLAQVQAIMEYFQGVANGKLTAENRKAKRDELMASICKSQISISTLGRISISDDIIKLLINSDSLVKETPFVERDEASTKLLKKHVADVFMSFGYGKKVYNAFLKIEQSIDFTHLDKSFNEDQINAFKNFKLPKGIKGSAKSEHSVLFLPKDDEKDVHAEAQILDKIINLVESENIALPQEIYLGISKKCCKNCHVLLMIAQIELKKLGISIKFGGAHDQSFDANWGQPPFFKKVSGSPKGRRTRADTKKRESELSLEELSLSERIRIKYFNTITKKKPKKDAEARYEIRHSPSSSDASLDSEQKLEILKKNLIYQYEILQKHGLVETQPAKTLKVVMNLCDSDVFQDILDSDPNIKGRQEEVTKRIIHICKERNIEFSEDDLMKFLSNPQLTGKILSNFFNGIEEPSSSRQQDSSEDEEHSKEFSEEEINRQIQDDYRLAWQLQADEYRKSKNFYPLSPNEFGDYSSPEKPPKKIYSIHNQTFTINHVKGDGECFFHAVNIQGFDREALVNGLLVNTQVHNIRKSFANEIRQFLYLGYSGYHERESEEHACQLLLGKHDSIIRTLFSSLQPVEQSVSNAVIDARHELGEEETHGARPEQLLDLLNDKLQDFMTDKEAQESNELRNLQELTTRFNQALEQRSNLNKNISDYCEKENVFKNYVNVYLGAAEGYVPLSRRLLGESTITTIDAINQIFGLNIQVHLLKGANSVELIQITTPRDDNGVPINIFHNGIDHFEGLQLSSPVLEEGIQQEFPHEEDDNDKNVISKPSHSLHTNLESHKRKDLNSHSIQLPMYEQQRFVKQKINTSKTKFDTPSSTKEDKPKPL